MHTGGTSRLGSGNAIYLAVTCVIDHVRASPNRPSENLSYLPTPGTCALALRWRLVRIRSISVTSSIRPDNAKTLIATFKDSTKIPLSKKSGGNGRMKILVDSVRRALVLGSNDGGGPSVTQCLLRVVGPDSRDFNTGLFDDGRWALGFGAWGGVGGAKIEAGREGGRRNEGCVESRAHVPGPSALSVALHAPCRHVSCAAWASTPCSLPRMAAGL